MASYADSSCCAYGFFAAMAMNINFALADNFTQHSYRFPDRLDASNMWFRTCQVSLFFAVPTAVVELYFSGAGSDLEALRHCIPLIMLSGVTFFLYNEAICQLLSLVPMS